MKRHLWKVLVVVMSLCLGLAIFAACGPKDPDAPKDTTYTVTYVAGGGTGTGGMPVGYPPPVPDYAGTANAPATMAADASQGDGKPKGGKRLLPQTDAPPVIGIATTGGIGMTGALVAHSILSARNRRR